VRRTLFAAGVAVVLAALWFFVFRQRPEVVSPAQMESETSSFPSGSSAVQPLGEKPRESAGIDLIEIPDAPEGSPALDIVDLERGDPLPGAWLILRTHARGDQDARPIGVRMRAGEDGCARIPEKELRSRRWDLAEVGAPERPTIVVAIEKLRAIFFPLTRLSATDPAQPHPYFGLPEGIAAEGCVRSLAGAPIEGVRVQASGQADLPDGKFRARVGSYPISWKSEGCSDGEGGFRLHFMTDPRESVRLDCLFRKDGYLPGFACLAIQERTVVTLFPAVEIRGVVRDALGGPVADARVMADPEFPESAGMEPVEAFPRRTWVGMSSDSDRTSSDGGFVLCLTEALAYRIRASSDGYAATEMTGYRPRAGEGLAIALRPESRATGRLLAAEGHVPVRDARVTVYFPKGMAGETAVSDSNGRIGFAFPPGDAGRELIFLAPGFGYRRLIVSVRGDGLQDLGDIVLEPGEDLSLIVIDGKGAPLPDIEVRIDRLRFGDAPFPALAGKDVYIAHRVTTGRSGSATFGHLMPGTYLVCAPEGWLSRDGGKSCFDVRVPEDSPLTVALVRQAKIVGSVVDEYGVGLPGAVVLLPSAAQASGEARTDKLGEFALTLPGGLRDADPADEALPDGRVLVVRALRYQERRIPLTRLPGPGETMDLGALELESEPHGALILDIPDLATEGEEMRIHLQKAGDFGFPTETQKGGWSSGGPEPPRVEWVRAGTYIIDVNRKGYVPWRSEPVTIADGEIRRITPSFERGLLLSGTVLDQETGAPLEGATIEWIGWQIFAATDSRGEFTLSGVPPGPGILSVDADGHHGFRTAVLAEEGFREPIRLRALKRREHVERTIELLYSLRDSDGLLLGVGVTAQIEVHGSPDLRAAAYPDRETGCRAVRLPSLGRFRFRVWTDGYLPSSWVDAPAVESGRVGPFEIEVEAGLETRVLVTDAAGAPVQGAKAYVKSENDRFPVGLSRMEDRTDATGEARMRPLPPGRYVINVRARNSARAEVEVSYSGGGEPIPVRISQGGVLEGTLRFLGRPFRVELWVSRWGMEYLEPEEHAFPFRIEHIPPGTSAVFARDEFGHEYARQTIEFRDGEVQRIEIVLPSTGAIEGTIRGVSGSARDSPPAVAVLEGRAVVAMTHAASDGRFSFPHLAPGKYTVKYMGHAGGVSTGMDVEVRSGETGRVDFDYRTWSLRGTVRKNDGSPIPTASILVEDIVDFSGKPIAVWPSGGFGIFGLPEGKAMIRVEAEGFVPQRLPVEMQGDRTLEIILSEGVPVDGLIRSSRFSHVEALAFWKSKGVVDGGERRAVLGHRPDRPDATDQKEGTYGFAGFVRGSFRIWIPRESAAVWFHPDRGVAVEVLLRQADPGGFQNLLVDIPSGSEEDP